MPNLPANRTSQPPAEGSVCFQHQDVYAKYYCHSCQYWRCKHCVKLFEKVALCPDCDALCVTVETYAQQAVEAVQRDTTFEEALGHAMGFPLRHPVSTMWVWLIGWFIACAVETLTDLAGGPRIEKIIFGAPDRVGILGTTLAVMFVSWMGFAYLRLRADGKEASRFSELTAVDEVFEPLAFWGMAFLIGIAPLLIHVGVPAGQKVVAIVFGDFPAEKYPKPGFGYYVGLVFWSLWAVVIYPLEMVVAATKKRWSDMLNPFAVAGAWVSLRPWLAPAAKSVLLLYLSVLVTGFAFYHAPLGTAVTMLVMAVASLIAGVKLGVALDYGYHSLDLEMTAPPPRRLSQRLAEDRDAVQ
ncbi:MAG: B-box zinc finger protein [Blastocatellia bacterium]|nr:B-box zinc finger protein [Blastocatellia bacterium]